MENWIMMLTNKVKKIMSKQTEHDGRFDAIDTALGNVDVQGVLDKIGNVEDSDNDTIFGKINSEKPSVKSVQILRAEYGDYSVEGELLISAVNPLKTVCYIQNSVTSSRYANGYAYVFDSTHVHILGYCNGIVHVIEFI